MSIFIDLRYGRSARDLSPSNLGFNGPVLGPFLGVRLFYDEVHVAKTLREFVLQFIGDWIIDDGALYADAGIIAGDKIGPRRIPCIRAFDPALAEVAVQDFG